MRKNDKSHRDALDSSFCMVAYVPYSLQHSLGIAALKGRGTS